MSLPPVSLQLKNVRKSYREDDGTILPILDIAEFSLAAREQVALVGESGSGKTTLLNVISGITLPDSGEVLINGQNLTTLIEPVRDRFRARYIGIVFQTFNLLPAFTALENVLLGMSFSGQAANRNRAKELLDRVGLGQRLSHRPGKLSVGEQQRVAVARALANQPTLLLADEPTASVDQRNQEKVLELIQTACREQQCALLMVTHSNDVASKFPRVARLSEFNSAARPVLQG